MRAAFLVSALFALLPALTAADFPALENLTEVSSAGYLNEPARRHLQQHGLVVMGEVGRTNLASCYYGLEMKKVPVYVTADSFLYLFYEAHRQAMMATEKGVLRPQLTELVARLLAATAKLEAISSEPLLADNARMLAVVRKLLNPEWAVPREYQAAVNPELVRVMEHTLVELYPGEDYTQYEVRGHYTKDAELSCYFRGAKYLARRYFRVTDRDYPAAADRELRRACLLALAMRQDPGLSDLYRQISDLRAFLAGPADTIGLDQLDAAAVAAWGEPWGRAELSDLGPLREELVSGRYPRARINTRATDPDAAIMPPWNVAVLGEHYLPDSELFHRTTEPAFPGRHLPSGLDVATALGSSDAAAKLGEVARDFPGVVAAADAFGKEMDCQGIYGAWLVTLRTLFARPDGLPPFAQTAAYRDKQLNSCLTSWTHLRHNYILYGAQAYSCAGLSSGFGIVEPLPEFFRAYAAMCQKLADRLSEVGVEGRVVRIILRLQSKSELFARCAADQLAGRDTSWAAGDIHGLGSWIMGCYFDTPAVIADVATSSETRGVLHVASGPFNPIVVLYESDGHWLGAVGWVGSYYEFVEPDMGRLTDEEWHSRIEASYGTPERPQWLAGLYAPQPAADAAPRRQLRELQAIITRGNMQAARQATEDFISEHEGTQWAPAAVLILGRHLYDAEDDEQAIEILKRAQNMYGCKARNDALALLRSCEYRISYARQVAEDRRCFEAALAATAPRDGISQAQEVARQNKRAHLLLKQGTVSDFMGFTSPDARRYLEQLVKECPASECLPFAELSIIICKWIEATEGFQHKPPPADMRRLQSDFLRLAHKYDNSIIGHAAAVAAASVLTVAGDFEGAFEATLPLLSKEPPDPEPYPLSAEWLEAIASRHTRVSDYEVTVDAQALVEFLVCHLIMPVYRSGDLVRTRQLIDITPTGGFHVSRDAIVAPKVYVQRFGDEPDAFRALAHLHATVLSDDVWEFKEPPPTPAELAREALDIATAFPDSRVAPAALYLSWDTIRNWKGAASFQELSTELRERLAARYPESLEYALAQLKYLCELHQYDRAMQFYDKVREHTPDDQMWHQQPTYEQYLVRCSVPRPAEAKARRERHQADMTARYGDFITQAGLTTADLAGLYGYSKLVRELLQRLPQQELAILAATDRLHGIETEVRAAIARHPDDPLSHDLRLRLGTPADLCAIIARGPDVLHFAEAVENFNAAEDTNRTALEGALAKYRHLAGEYAGTPAEVLSLAVIARTYLWHDRPEQALEFLDAALATTSDGRLFRDDLVALQRTASAQVAAKREQGAQQVWAADVQFVGRYDEQYSPLLVAGRLIARRRTFAGDGGVVALDAATGEILWETPTEQITSIVSLGSRLFVATGFGTVLCLDVQTGHRLWRSELGLSQVGSVWCAAAGELVLVYWEPGRLCALDAASGRTVWQDDVLLRTLEQAHNPAPSSFLAISECLFYTVTPDQVVRCRRATDGVTIWSCHIRDIAPNVDQKKLARVELGQPFRCSEGVIVGTGGGSALAVSLSPTTGQIQWRNPISDGVYLARLSNAPSDTFFASHGKRLSECSSADGTTIWSLATPTECRAPFVQVGRHILLPKGSGLVVVDRRLGGIVAQVSTAATSIRGVAGTMTPSGLRAFVVGRKQITAWDVPISQP